MNIPTTADIVIIGGGVMSASAAYHLAKCGIKNIVLLEKEEFFGTGATGRSADAGRPYPQTNVCDESVTRNPRRFSLCD